MRKPPEKTVRAVLNNLELFTRVETALPLLTDDVLDYWGEFFVRNRLHTRGVLFETFIRHPREIAEALIFNRRREDPEDFLPLLPAQRRAIAKPGARARAISRPLVENVCIGCGCTDSHGCLTREGTCHWIRLDAKRLIGVCSECQALASAWDEARAGGPLPMKTTNEILARARAE